MIFVLGAFLFWLMLYGRLGTYAGFVTTANPAGGIGSIFSGFSIPLKLITGSTSPVGALTRQPDVGKPNTGKTASGQAMTGGDVMSDKPPGTYTNFLGLLTGPQDNGSNIYSPSADSVAKYLPQARGYVQGGAAGL